MVFQDFNHDEAINCDTNALGYKTDELLDSIGDNIVRFWTVKIHQHVNHSSLCSYLQMFNPLATTLGSLGLADPICHVFL